MDKGGMNPKVDQYLTDGCMRCPFGATPACKVHRWREVLEGLRQVVLETGLTEEVKWGVPCYTSNNKNIVLVSAFKDYVSLSFLKGALLRDEHHLLLKPGENSQSARMIKYTNKEQVMAQAEIIKAYILEAAEMERSGQKVAFRKNPEPMPDELISKFREDPEFKAAFHALTPGRQRGYIIYFSQPKQALSRLNRIEKYKQKILDGRGLQE